MVETIVVGIISLVVGFGIGRIKNISKLTAIKTEVLALETKVKGVTSVVVADILAAITKIKAKL